MSLRYQLETGAFLKSQGWKLSESSVVPATVTETSSGIPSSVSIPSAMSPPPSAPTTDFGASTAPEEATLSTPPSEVSHKDKVST